MDFSLFPYCFRVLQSCGLSVQRLCHHPSIAILRVLRVFGIRFVVVPTRALPLSTCIRVRRTRSTIFVFSLAFARSARKTNVSSLRSCLRSDGINCNNNDSRDIFNKIVVDLPRHILSTGFGRMFAGVIVLSVGFTQTRTRRIVAVGPVVFPASRRV